jgi:hypothetical protein
MPEVLWADMEQSCPKAHLIVAVVPAEETAVTASALKLRVELLARLARHLQLRGVYAIADFPEDNISRDVRFMVQHAEEAAALAEVLKAEDSADHPEYASYRTFRCDDQAAAAIEARLREETMVSRKEP